MRTGALALVAALLALAPPAAAGPPSAVAPGYPKPCGWRPAANGPGTALADGNWHLWNGPGSQCSTTGSVHTFDVLYLHCYAYSIHNVKWWYVRVQDTQTYGWISGDNLDIILDKGGYAAC